MLLDLNLSLDKSQLDIIDGGDSVYSRFPGGARRVLQYRFNQENPYSKALLVRIIELDPQSSSVVTP